MVETSIIAQLATQFGAPGLLVGFMVWRELLQRSDRKVEREEDLAVRKDRADADKALASSLSALTVTIQNLDRK